MLPLGAVLHDCIFRLDWRDVRPLYDAPCRGETGPDFKALPPIIQSLGSDWPCVPPGRPPDPMTLPAGWAPSDAQPWGTWTHGYASNHEWKIARLGDCALRAVIPYPQTTLILRLERTVHLSDDRPGLTLSLTVHARRETRFPQGLNPVMSKEGAALGAMRLRLADDPRGWSFPSRLSRAETTLRPTRWTVRWTRLSLARVKPGIAVSCRPLGRQRIYCC